FLVAHTCCGPGLVPWILPRMPRQYLGKRRSMVYMSTVVGVPVDSKARLLPVMLWHTLLPMLNHTGSMLPLARPGLKPDTSLTNTAQLPWPTNERQLPGCLLIARTAGHAMKRNSVTGAKPTCPIHKTHMHFPMTNGPNICFTGITPKVISQNVGFTTADAA